MRPQPAAADRGRHDPGRRQTHRCGQRDIVQRERKAIVKSRQHTGDWRRRFFVRRRRHEVR
jgi:hypothetical protein